MIPMPSASFLPARALAALLAAREHPEQRLLRDADLARVLGVASALCLSWRRRGLLARRGTMKTKDAANRTGRAGKARYSYLDLVGLIVARTLAPFFREHPEVPRRAAQLIRQGDAAALRRAWVVEGQGATPGSTRCAFYEGDDPHDALANLVRATQLDAFVQQAVDMLALRLRAQGVEFDLAGRIIKVPKEERKPS